MRYDLEEGGVAVQGRGCRGVPVVQPVYLACLRVRPHYWT
jgi:hypothetical protein